MNILLFKSALAVGMVLPMLAFSPTGVRFLDRVLPTSSRGLLLAALLLRGAPFVLIYLVVGYQPQSDVGTAFYPWGLAALNGQLVYRDFAMDYSPLFPYLLAVGLFFWNDARMIVALMMLVELAALAVTFRLFDSQMSVKERVRASYFYLLSPAPFLLVVLGGQEDVWLWFVGALVIGALLAGRHAMAGIIGGIGLFATKAYLLFFLIPLVVMQKFRWHFLAGLGLTIVLTWTPMAWLVGNAILTPLRQAGNWSPPNLWFTFQALTGGKLLAHNHPLVTIIGVGLVLGLAAFFAFKYRAQIQSSVLGYATAWVMLYCLLMLFSPKSLGNYAGIFLMPLTFLVMVERDQLAAVVTAALNVLVSIQPSLWFRLGTPTLAEYSYLSSAPLFLELVLEVMMLGCLMVLVWRGQKWIFSVR